MLENKITNKVFQTVWDDLTGDPQVADIQNKRKLAPGAWRKDEDGTDLLIDGLDAALPVLGVTVPVPLLVANKLAEMLPTFQQWKKATGDHGTGYQ